MVKVASYFCGGKGDEVDYAVVCGCGVEECW